ncbi:MAG: S24 family peptidase [Gammaproteobacteria bacterium]
MSEINKTTEDTIKEQVLHADLADHGGCANSEPFALRVMGDSMEPEFKDGCIIIIDSAATVESGSYVLAMIDEEYIFRQFIAEDDRYYLRALKEGYEEISLSSRDAVRGVIVQRAGTRRKDHKHYT